MAEPHRYTPGESAAVAGLYVIVDAAGNPVTGVADPDTEYTLAEGDTFPPTPRAGLFFVLHRAAHHAGDDPDPLTPDVMDALVDAPGIDLPDGDA